MALIIRNKVIKSVLWGAIPLIAVACGQPPEDEPTLATQELKAENGISFNGISFNGISFNGISFNGISFNGISFNGISFNGISFNGISFNGMSPGGLADPTTHRVVEYLISCALPASDRVTYDIGGQTYSFAGRLGLAPEWKDGACGTSCQRWVSACMMARVNAAGHSRMISLRGAHAGLTVQPRELQDFPQREATYYGNIFLQQPVVYACLSPGRTTIPRVCGDSLEKCALPVVGTCDVVCQGTGRFDSFRNCAPGPVAKGPEESVFSEAVTVFLPNE